MRNNRWLKIVVVLAALAVGWVLLVYTADWPISRFSYFACPICRARKIITSYMMIPVRTTVNDNEFSRYYRSHADLSHQHIWLKCGGDRVTRTGVVSGHSIPDALRLRYEAALAIIKSLPDREARKAFFERLYVPDRSSPEAQRILKAIWELNDTYWENEHRISWLDQIRKVGLYPNTASGKHQPQSETK